jgi:hypothetical protein
MQVRAVVLLVALTGCTAAFRTTNGGAMAKPGLSGGITNSIVLEDRGGPLTRAGFAVLGIAAATGSVKYTGSSSSDAGVYDSGGNRVGTQTTTTYSGTVDPAAGQAAQNLVDSANAASNATLKAGAIDPTQNYISPVGGLEIATRNIGGDTSGWMFDFGVKAARRYGAWGLRWSARLGFGRFTFHDRNLAIGGVGSMQMVDSQSTYVGFPLRLGVTYRGLLEVFARLDLNLVTVFNEGIGEEDSSPSPWRAGGRVFLFKRAYVEAGLMLSAMRKANTSTMLEVGLEF